MSPTSIWTEDVIAIMGESHHANGRIDKTHRSGVLVNPVDVGFQRLPVAPTVLRAHEHVLAAPRAPIGFAHDPAMLVIGKLEGNRTSDMPLRHGSKIPSSPPILRVPERFRAVCEDRRTITGMPPSARQNWGDHQPGLISIQEYGSHRTGKRARQGIYGGRGSFLPSLSTINRP